MNFDPGRAILLASMQRSAAAVVDALKQAPEAIPASNEATKVRMHFRLSHKMIPLDSGPCGTFCRRLSTSRRLSKGSAAEQQISAAFKPATCMQSGKDHHAGVCTDAMHPG